MRRSRCVRISVTLPRRLLTELDKLVSQGFKSRSQAVAEAVRRLIEELRVDWRGRVVCIVSYCYEGHHSSEELRELGHRYLDVVVSTLHIHVSEDLCFEAVALKGEAERVRSFIREIGRVKGVKHLAVSAVQLSEL
ncbi:MAG: hypothetical protein DRK00_01260 [Thermoprotei archaeon]|nr:MAG: hypothetical protein DRK00_01260 [Thermoprotei archaeon]